ncbi:MAG: RNA polymerase sigma factor [Kofleriaceae bacterium]
MTARTEQWWEAFLAGDLNAFALVIAHHEQDVLAVALATVLDHALAEDVAQEAFIAAFTHRDRLRDPAALGGWLAAITRNLGRDLLRTRRREQLVDAPDADVASDHPSPTEQLEREALRHQVRRALERVPGKYREVVILYYSLERSIDSIGKTLGITHAAALQRLSRGRKLVERYGASLREFVGDAKPKRSFALGVLALLALRGRATASTPPPSSTWLQRASQKVGWLAGVGVILALGGDTRAVPSPGDDSARPALPAASALASTATTTQVRSESARAVVAPSPIEREPRRRPSSHHRVAAATPPPPPQPPEPPTSPLKPPRVEHTPASITLPSPQPRRSRWDMVNGFLETAALPEPGDVSIETAGMGLIVRGGITRHVAVHAAFTGIDVVRGEHSRPAPAVGGGLKLGMRISDAAAIAVFGEAARALEVENLFKPKDAWLGRAYAAISLGNARHLVTLTAGVSAIDNGEPRWVSPTFGIGTTIGWDPRLAFVFENQYFTRAHDMTRSTSVIAVRLRTNGGPPNFLRIDRTRLDVGVLLLHQTDDDLTGAPWLQVALGW